MYEIRKGRRGAGADRKTDIHIPARGRILCAVRRGAGTGHRSERHAIQPARAACHRGLRNRHFGGDRRRRHPAADGADQQHRLCDAGGGREHRRGDCRGARGGIRSVGGRRGIYRRAAAPAPEAVQMPAGAHLAGGLDTGHGGEPVGIRIRPGGGVACGASRWGRMMPTLRATR